MVSVVVGDDIIGYEPDQDADLYEYWKAEPRYWETVKQQCHNVERR